MARPKKNTAAIKLVRRERKSGDISARKRGRPNPAFENGYLDESGAFVAGNPPKRRGRKGRWGRRPGRPVGSTNAAVAARSAGGLGEIERIVRREVELRLRAAKEAALSAFNRALGV